MPNNLSKAILILVHLGISVVLGMDICWKVTLYRSINLSFREHPLLPGVQLQRLTSVSLC